MRVRVLIVFNCGAQACERSSWVARDVCVIELRRGASLSHPDLSCYISVLTNDKKILGVTPLGYVETDLLVDSSTVGKIAPRATSSRTFGAYCAEAWRSWRAGYPLPFKSHVLHCVIAARALGNSVVVTFMENIVNSEQLQHRSQTK